ncbi:Rrf2 family transcriptional regulator [Noviherbaspirillum sp.]|jgi:DNA-binding IscR family transcriptional regulator|uniref:Rrf2 family transcriptional regulator n=1 Tax=Noviherbaspirillum sp. TaxID=1926288 RepID=UPI0025DA54FB|nr:Rrf2 family transcriptional regulator [Noviherbaspirillum sp.]
MTDIDHYFLGDADLHQRLAVGTGILAELVRCAPRAVGISALENATGYPAQVLEKNCRHLCRAGLLQPDDSDRWLLAGAPSEITLEDVFRAVLTDSPTCDKKNSSQTKISAGTNDVELLLMQATVGIHQHIFNYLRRFSLDRVKISGAGMFPQTTQRACDFCRDEAPAELH